MSKPESPEEVQYRLQSEKDCRRIADLVKKEMPGGRIFVLVTADVGGGPDARFSNTAYVSTGQRDDCARLLTELLDHLRADGNTTEPTIQTATRMREAVYGLSATTVGDLAAGARRRVGQLAGALRANDTRAAAIRALTLATEAMAIFDQLVRKLNQPGGN